MIAWLDANPVGKALLAVSGALVAVVLLLALAWSLPPRGTLDDGPDGGRDLAVVVPELPEPAPIAEFAVITDRPVFNESRQPDTFLDEDEEQQEEQVAEQADVDAPDVTLSGVVITPSLRMATLRAKGNPESLIALEGEPLEGDYGSWHVSSVAPRSVVLQSGSGEQVQLDLQIHDAVIAEPPKPPPAAGAGDGGAATG